MAQQWFPPTRPQQSSHSAARISRLDPQCGVQRADDGSQAVSAPIADAGREYKDFGLRAFCSPTGLLAVVCSVHTAQQSNEWYNTARIPRGQLVR